MFKKLRFKQHLRFVFMILFATIIESWNAHAMEEHNHDDLKYGLRFKKKPFAPKNKQEISDKFHKGVFYLLEHQLTKARWSFEDAATAGHAGSQLNLGIMYQEGYGVPKDNTKALKWFKEAHKNGHSKALQGIVNLKILMKCKTLKSGKYLPIILWSECINEEGCLTVKKTLIQYKKEFLLSRIQPINFQMI